MKFKDDVKLIETDTLCTIINGDGKESIVDQKDVWLVKEFLKKNILMEDALKIISQRNNEEYPWVNFTLAQFIVNYADYIDDKDEEDETNRRNLK